MLETPPTKRLKVLNVCETAIQDERVHNLLIDDDDSTTHQEWCLFLDTSADLVLKYLQAGDIVVVACVAGINRSAAAVIAYLMKHKGIGMTNAKKLIEYSKAVPKRVMKVKNR